MAQCSVAECHEGTWRSFAAKLTRQLMAAWPGYLSHGNTRLDEVKCNPYLLPHCMMAWDALEQDFKMSFIDYAMHEKAHEQLRNLKMKEGNVDQFITDFKFLAHRAQVNTDDLTILHLFKMGISVCLMDVCVDHGPLTNFEQWTKAA